jgi:hypothetical protein
MHAYTHICMYMHVLVNSCTYRNMHTKCILYFYFLKLILCCCFSIYKKSIQSITYACIRTCIYTYICMYAYFTSLFFLSFLEFYSPIKISLYKITNVHVHLFIYVYRLAHMYILLERERETKCSMCKIILFVLCIYFPNFQEF